MRKKRVTAVALTAALMISGIFPCGTADVGKRNTVQAEETQPAEEQVQTTDAVETATDTEETVSETDAGVYDDETVDYDYIIDEAKQQDYRDNVEIADDKVMLVSTQSQDEITASGWYSQIEADEISILNQSEEDGYTVYTYEIKTSSDDIWGIIDKLNEEEGVLIAEPDYIYHLQDDGVPTEVSDEDMGSEWYLNDLNVADTWTNLNTSGKSAGENVIVAVIDTGVDYTHKDLVDNMWLNTAELTGSAGVDDDGNGYVDDIYGISLIDNSGNPADDHGHGTHVAGIIAMSAGNGGGVGIAYQSQIMAIKAGQSDGSFASSDIAKAIRYAVANGADVINMSFGGYGHSAIMESALQDAFGKCVLVAAAGNDSYPTSDATDAFYLKGNMYPAAYSYVVGVMAYDQNGKLTDFSNWDYRNNFGAEYEIVAPGKNIYSTLPGDKYASWSGTSMAAPMVSAVAALIRSEYPDKNAYNSRFIMGQLVSATTDSLIYTDKEGLKHEYAKLNISDSLNNLPKPNITVQDVYLFDSPEISDANNGDGIVQAGETIDIGVILRNQWGAATDLQVQVSSTSDGGVDNPYVTFVTDKNIDLEDIGTFSTQDNGLTKDSEGTVIGVDNPVRIKISEDTPNDASITLTVNYTAKNQMDENDTHVYTLPLDKIYKYQFTVQKGKVLKGKITSDMTLTSDQYWIIENSVLIPKGITVNVEPGTQIQFWSSDSNSVYADQNMAYIQVEGTLNIKGTQEKPVEMFPGKGYESYAVDLRLEGNGKTYVEYAKITNPRINITTGNHLDCTQDYDYVYYRYIYSGNIELTSSSSEIYAQKISNSKFSNLRGGSYYNAARCYFVADTVLFDNCHIAFSGMSSSDSVYLINSAAVDDWNGIVYNTSSMENAGYSFKLPSYEVSSVYELNGEKYAVMQFTESSYFGIANTKDNYDLLIAAIEENGGTLGSISYDNYELLDMMDADEKLTEMVGTKDYSVSLLTSLRYDEEKKGMVDETQELVDMDNYYCLSTGNSSACYTSLEIYFNNKDCQLYNNKTQTYFTGINSYYGTTNWLPYLVLVKYPSSVSDEKIQNPYISIDSIDMNKYDTFTNNAILNKLTQTDTTTWMKFSTNYSNEKVFNVRNNYWGTTSETLIDKQIIDFDDIISLADYISTPYLTEGNAEMYPFVTDIYITDKDGKKVTSLSNGTYNIHVLFNRDMDTTVSPYVTYGPDAPYTDYVVDGSFVNTREWVGTATVNVIINQGTQYFRVKDAQAADDAWLTTGTDWGRFSFSIEATGAEALTLHGEGGENQNELNWVQDDYETLAGYNLYRSTYYNKDSENPLDGFQKINTTVIGAGTNDYVDTDVLPGVTYYYYFKVVDTAMTESKASNVVVCKTVDNIAPTITHIPVTSAKAGLGLSINADVTDNIGIDYVTVYYKAKSADAWNSQTLSNTSGNTYFVSIPASELVLGDMVYYLEANDGTSSTYAGTKDAPYTFEVKEVATITSVTPDTLETTESGQTGTVKGIFFTEGMQVYVDDVAVDTQYVSDKILTFTVPELCMGQKNVSVYKDGVEVAKYENAITYTDKTVKVYTDDIVGLKSNYAYAALHTNYEGSIKSLEIVTSDNIYYNDNNASRDSDYSENYQQWVNIYKAKNINGFANLGSLNIPLSYDLNAYKLFSVKINGVEVQNVSLGNITAYSEDEITAVQSISTKSTIDIRVGETIQLEAEVVPANATIKTLSWSSGYGNISLTSDGTLTGLSDGTAWIYCYSQDGSNIYKEILVNVKGEDLESITMEQTEITLMKGDSAVLNFVTAPLNARVSNITYSYSNYDVSSVVSYNSTEGTMTIVAKEVGISIIQLYDTTHPEIAASCTVKVIENDAYVETEENIITLSEGDSYQAAAVIKNAQTLGNLTCKWSSSNPSVAKVNANGEISFVGEGTAVISAALESNGASDSIVVLCGKSSSTVTVGDVNGDGAVNVQDAMLALQLISSGKLTKEFIRRADVNGDGGLSSVDALMILQYATGKITTFQ